MSNKAGIAERVRRWRARHPERAREQNRQAALRYSRGRRERDLRARLDASRAALDRELEDVGEPRQAGSQRREPTGDEG